MKRKLIQQMLNEWRSDVWLLLQLMTVMLVLTYICGFLCSLYADHGYPTGRKLRDIYSADIHVLPNESDRYVPYDSVYTRQQDLDTLLSRLRTNPYVEMVATGGGNSMPYSSSYYGGGLMYRTAEGFSRRFEANNRQMSPELLVILGIRGVNGETPQQLAEILRQGNIILANAEVNGKIPSHLAELQRQGNIIIGIADSTCTDASEFLDKGKVYNLDTVQMDYPVGAIAYGMRRYDYEPMREGNAYLPLSDDASKIVVRVKPGMGRAFVESLSNLNMEAGNLYINRYRSIESMRDDIQGSINQNIRNFIFCTVVILLMVFLAFLGTFWLRTQQRMEEIAIRKVNGATNVDIYRRCFGEGLILLAAAAVLMLPVVEWLFPRLPILNIVAISPVRTAVGFLIAVILLAIPILGGIYAPARRATRIEPVDALKDM